jgi:hypothetical protein
MVGVGVAGDVPADDVAGVGVDDERGIGEAAAGDRHVGEVGHEQPVRGGGVEAPVDQVGRPVHAGAHSGTDPPLAAHPAPPIGPHEPLHRAPGHRHALALQVGPHLRGPVQRLGPAAPGLVGFVDAGQQLGDDGVHKARRDGLRAAQA